MVNYFAAASAPLISATIASTAALDASPKFSAERQIVAEIIREKALHSLNEEIPHGIAVAIDQMKMNHKVCHIDATIICERDSHKGIIIGKQGSMLKKIGSTARFEIERLLDCKVNLKLWVKVQKNWRDSDYMMKNFGYREDEM